MKARHISCESADGGDSAAKCMLLWQKEEATIENNLLEKAVAGASELPSSPASALSAPLWRGSYVKLVTYITLEHRQLCDGVGILRAEGAIICHDGLWGYGDVFHLTCTECVPGASLSNVFTPDARPGIGWKASASLMLFLWLALLHLCWRRREAKLLSK